MKDQGNQKGRSRKPEATESKTPAVAGGKEPGVKTAPMTSKEKIAANQKNKRRK
jgi:hypothetical protein